MNRRVDIASIALGLAAMALIAAIAIALSRTPPV